MRKKTSDQPFLSFSIMHAEMQIDFHKSSKLPMSKHFAKSNIGTLRQCQISKASNVIAKLPIKCIRMLHIPMLVAKQLQEILMLVIAATHHGANEDEVEGDTPVFRVFFVVNPSKVVCIRLQPLILMAEEIQRVSEKCTPFIFHNENELK